MKLTEMTNDQLVNIILRKDDVETRLRKEIATLQQENKRLVKVKRYRVLAIGLIIALICMEFIGFSSCKTNKQPVKGKLATAVLSIWEVEFGVNIDVDGIRLITSTQPDDPKMKQVIEYLTSIYGEPVENQPDDYWWYSGAKDDYLGRLVARLRPLHSEEGGTVLIIENYK